MKKKIKQPGDGVNWLHYPVTVMKTADQCARIRIGPVTESYTTVVFKDERITLSTHMSVGKNKIVGYTLQAQEPCQFYVPGEGGLGVFFDTESRNMQPVLLFEDQTSKLHGFVSGSVMNYALAVRT